MRTIHVFVLLASSIAIAKSPARENGIVYGGGVAFALRAPSGWVLDNESGRAQGLDAVFYAKGSSFADAHAVAFARVLPKRNQTLAQVIEHGFSAMRQHAPKLEIDRESTLTCGRKPARFVTLAHDPAGNVEALAFVDEPTTVILIGLLAQDAAQRAAAMPRLRELCGSYHFVGNVTR
jgi:hypothetical protein